MVRITNAVTGLTASDVTHFGERFWRKDQARSDGLHCGLGLALTRTVCQANGMSVVWDMPDEAHVRVSLTLPS